MLALITEADVREVFIRVVIDGVTCVVLVREDEWLLLVSDEESLYICEQQSVDDLVGDLLSDEVDEIELSVDPIGRSLEKLLLSCV